MELSSSRPVGLVLLAVTVVAIAALLLGYGVPAGIGALAGLLLGALAGIALVLWPLRRAGNGVRIARMSGSGAFDARPSDEALEMMRDMAELSQVDLGRATKVLPVLTSETHSGLAVHLVAITLYEAGLRLDVEARPSAGITPPGHFAQVTIQDDAGTIYRASGQGTGASSPPRFEVRAIPVPPPGVRSLKVRIDAFGDPFPHGTRQVDGPWTFEVDLASAG